MAESLAVRRERFAQPDAAEIMVRQYQALMEQYNQSGNIDLNNRLVVQNPDGSISTVRSVGVTLDGRETLLPTVADGRILSTGKAIARYRHIGENLGRFDTVDQANAYAKALHDQQKSRGIPRPTRPLIRISAFLSAHARQIVTREMACRCGRSRRLTTQLYQPLAPSGVS